MQRNANRTSAHIKAKPTVRYGNAHTSLNTGISIGTRSVSVFSGRKMKLLEIAGLCCKYISNSRLMNVEIMMFASDTTATRPSSAHFTQSGTSGLPAMRSRELVSVQVVVVVVW